MKGSVISVLLLIASSCHTFVQCKVRLEIEYKKLDKHLSEIVQDEKSIDEIMEETKRWFDEELAASDDKSLKEAVEGFLALTKLEQETSCSDSKTSYDILFKNLLGTGSRSLNVETSFIIPRRIDYAVNHYGLMHARKCHDYYPKELFRRYQEMDQFSARSVATWIGSLRANQLTERTSISGTKYANFTLDILIRLIKDGNAQSRMRKTKDRLLSKKQFDEIFNQYLVQPCIDYMHETNHDSLIDAAVLDYEFSAPIYHYKCNFSLFANFYNICKRFVEHDASDFRKEVFRAAVSAGF